MDNNWLDDVKRSYLCSEEAMKISSDWDSDEKEEGAFDAFMEQIVAPGAQAYADALMRVIDEGDHRDLPLALIALESITNGLMAASPNATALYKKLREHVIAMTAVLPGETQE